MICDIQKRDLDSQRHELPDVEPNGLSVRLPSSRLHMALNLSPASSQRSGIFKRNCEATGLAIILSSDMSTGSCSGSSKTQLRGFSAA